jgi:hypothetical protein
MANILTAGNSSNGGTAISTDTSGTLNIVTGSGSGANAITIDASQNVTTGANLTVTGTLTASGGVSGGIRSGTAVASTSGTSVEFTSLPTGLKRITVMFQGVSTSGTSNKQVQIGSGSFTTSGYASSYVTFSTSTLGAATFSTGFPLYNIVAADNISGMLILTLLTGNTWVASANVATTGANPFGASAGSIALGGTLDRVRVTTVNGTDTFDAGNINILYE